MTVNPGARLRRGRCSGFGNHGSKAVIHRAEAGRPPDSETVEPAVSALAARRARGPGSKLAAIRRVAGRVAIHRLAGFSDEEAYQVTDFLLGALPKITGEVLAPVGAPDGI